MITTEFPPTPVVGALRQGKLAAELDRLGWRVTVLTVDDATHTPTLDSSGVPLPPLGYTVPDTVCSTKLGAWNPVAWASRIRRRIRHIGFPEKGPAPASTGINWRGRLTAVFDKWSVPDEYALWIPRTVRAGVQEVRDSGADVIWGSWPWTSAVVAATFVSRRTGVPLVVDFRDSWEAWPPRVASGRVRRSVEKRIERWLLGRAAGVTAVTKGIVSEILDGHPHLEGRVRFFPQGFDPAEARRMNGPPISASDGVLRFIHGGRLTTKVADLTPLLVAAKRLAEAGAIDRSRVRFIFLGATLVDVEGIAAGLGVSDMVEAHPQVERNDALVAFRGADVCMLIRTNSNEDWVTGKLWDYLTVGRPILALVDGRSTASDIISEVGAGVVVDLDDGDVGAAVSGLWERFRSGDLHDTSDEKERARYSTPQIARDVARFLAEVASSHTESAVKA